jgi:hypothetical protein
MAETLLHSQQVIAGCFPLQLLLSSRGQLLEFDYVLWPGIFAFLDQLLAEGHELAVFTAGIPLAATLVEIASTAITWLRTRRTCVLSLGTASAGALLRDDSAHEVCPDKSCECSQGQQAKYVFSLLLASNSSLGWLMCLFLCVLSVQ